MKAHISTYYAMMESSFMANAFIWMSSLICWLIHENERERANSNIQMSENKVVKKLERIFPTKNPGIICGYAIF